VVCRARCLDAGQPAQLLEEVRGEFGNSLVGLVAGKGNRELENENGTARFAVEAGLGPLYNEPRLRSLLVAGFEIHRGVTEVAVSRIQGVIRSHPL